jgi:hypothetical protein
MSDDNLKFTITQAVRLRRLENAAAHRIGKLFDENAALLLKPFDVVDSELIRAQVVIEFELRVLRLAPVMFERLRSTAERDALSIALSESEKTAGAMLKAANVETLAKPVSLERLRAIYQGDAIEGFTADQWWRHNERKLRERVRIETREGLAKGESLAEIRARVENNALLRSKRHAEALSRTSANNLSNAAIWETGEANPNLSRGYRLIVTFDRRTSKICIAYGERNLIYPYRAGSPRPPFHFLCRTIIQPVIRGHENDKPVDAGRWLKGQSIETQNEILGPRRAELFRKGKIDLSDLIRGDNTIATIPELRGVASIF